VEGRLHEAGARTETTRVRLMAIRATLYTDSACPWAYSATPALTTLRWRYRGQLDWRLVMIGLRDDTGAMRASGYTPGRQAAGARRFRDRYGMPFAAAPRSRLIATGRGCRAVVATRLAHPGREFAAQRALAFAWFTTGLLLDEDDAIATALAPVPGIDARAVVTALDSPEVEAAYGADKAETRSAAGGATEFQGKAAVSDGQVRFTAPSVVFESDGQRLEAGGFQPLEAYDVCVANLDATLERHLPPEDPADLLAHFPDGLCTQEVAVLLAGNLVDVDRSAAEDALLDLVAEGRATREPLGDDALWRAA
jgi:2-hydroxychromene-2-carboxylate isomerase